MKPTLDDATPDPSGLVAPSGFGLADSLDSAARMSGLGLRAGTTLGKYTIEAEVGRGGMAVVYRATQAGLDRQVALKVLSEGPTTSQERVERFFREARAAASLTHPNIVPVHEVGDEGGVRFLAMEFVEGHTLDEAIRREELTWRRAAEVVRDAARALHYAHGQGVVHRDVKPGNIMLEPGGTPRVTDFGLARVEGGGALTADGTAIGTPAYMSPEQAAGDQSAIGPATDVYALGAVLYESLTGRPPAVGESVLEILHAVQIVEPPAIRKLAPGTPADLATVTEKAIAKNLGERYTTAAELADELDRVLTGDSILARPPGPLQRGIRLARRHPLLMAASGVAVLAVLAGGGIWVQLQRTRSGLDQANRATEAANNRAAQARIAKETRDRELQEARPAFERADAKLETARIARRSNDDATAKAALAQARALVNTALQTAPHFAEAWLVSARLHSLSGHHAEALSDYGQAIEHNPSLSEAYYERVRLQFDRHFTVHVAAGLQDAEANQAIKADLAHLKALEARPAQAHAAQAMAMLLEANFDGADEAVAAALAEDPYFPDAFALRGGVRLGQGYYLLINADVRGARAQFAAAVKQFEDAVKFGADPDQILAGRAQAQAELGRFPQAIADAERFVELDPQDADRWFLQARILKIAGQKDAAAAALSRARALAADTPEHHLQAATVLLADKMRAGRTQTYEQMLADLVEAKQELDWVVAHAPNHPVARFYRALVNSSSGDLPSAAADLRVFLNEVPEHSKYRDKALGMLEAIEQQLQGRSEVERATARQRELLGAQERSQQAFKLLEQGKSAEAEAIYLKVLADIDRIEQAGEVLDKLARKYRGSKIRVGDIEIDIDESGFTRVVTNGRVASQDEKAKGEARSAADDSEADDSEADDSPAAKLKTRPQTPSGEERKRSLLGAAESALREELAKLPAEARRQFEVGRRQVQQRNRASWGRELGAQVKQIAHYNVACLLAVRAATSGDAAARDQALTHLEQSIGAGFSEYRHLRGDADLKSLHGHPRFQRALDACAQQAQRSDTERKAKLAAYKAQRRAGPEPATPPAAGHESEKR